MTPQEWIDKVRNVTGSGTDYAVAGATDISISAVKAISEGDTSSLSDINCIRIAKALNTDSIPVLLDQRAISDDADVSAAYEKLLTIYNDSLKLN